MPRQSGLPAPSQVLSVRLSREERALLARAAEHERTNLSDFVRRKAVEAAEIEMLHRRVVTISAADWERFEAWTRRPAQDVPSLRALAAHEPGWRD